MKIIMDYVHCRYDVSNTITCSWYYYGGRHSRYLILRVNNVEYEVQHGNVLDRDRMPVATLRPDRGPKAKGFVLIAPDEWLDEVRAAA